MRKFIAILQYEFRHFVRSPFKIVSMILFIGATVYGLQNGYALLEQQNKEIEAIQVKNKESITEVIGWFDAGKKGPDDKPWIDVTAPMRAIWYAPASVAKAPSPYMPFSIGQAEQFGYYKRVTNWSSTFDSDLAEEIANPERLTVGTLDFGFVVLYLLPVLAIILLFNIGGMEKDLDFDRLIQVNHSSLRKWLLARFSFYFLLIIGMLLVLMLVYCMRTNALSGTFIGLYALIVLYTLIWFIAFYFINLKGKGSSNQAIKMVSLWLLFCVIVPGSLHQIASLKYPGSYMTDYLDASRDESYKLYELSADTIKQRLMAIYPALNQTVYGKDTLTDEGITRNSISGLTNTLIKEAAVTVELSNENKNRFIRNTSWLNPVGWFQNRMNALCGTDYYAYRRFRNEIQSMIDKKVEILLQDSWNKETVDKKKFMEYINTFNVKE